MKYYKAVGCRFNELLQEKGMTKVQLARETGISYRCVLRITTGKVTKLSVYRFYELCKAVGIKLADFFDSPLFDFRILDKISR